VDSINILGIVIFTFVFIFLFILFSRPFKPLRVAIKASIKGWLGEKQVDLILGRDLQGVRHTINDYIIEQNGKTSQIDHIYICSRGVFIIETKNYSGRIYGNDDQLEWVQVLKYGRVKNKIYNPVKQNATHAYRIRSLLGDVPLHPVVVMVKNNTSFIDSESVIPLKWLKNYISEFDECLTAEDIEEIYLTLINNRSDITTEEHVRNIRVQQHQLKENICPRCGGKLVERKGSRGVFMGCSNYPKCKFTKNI